MHTGHSETRLVEFCESIYIQSTRRTCPPPTRDTSGIIHPINVTPRLCHRWGFAPSAHPSSERCYHDALVNESVNIQTLWQENWGGGSHDEEWESEEIPPIPPRRRDGTHGLRGGGARSYPSTRHAGWPEETDKEGEDRDGQSSCDVRDAKPKVKTRSLLIVMDKIHDAWEDFQAMQARKRGERIEGYRKGAGRTRLEDGSVGWKDWA